MKHIIAAVNMRYKDETYGMRHYAWPKKRREIRDRQADTKSLFQLLLFYLIQDCFGSCFSTFLWEFPAAVSSLQDLIIGRFIHNYNIERDEAIKDEEI